MTRARAASHLAVPVGTERWTGRRGRDARSIGRFAAVVGILAVLALGSGCAIHHYSYQSKDGAEQRLRPVRATVVSHREAARYGQPTPLRIPFATGRDGTQLVAEFLAQADARRVEHVADLAIVIQTSRDGRAVECRSEIVPESVTSSEWRPPTTRSVSVYKPTTKMVTESVHRCKPVTSSQMRSHSESEQQCSTVSHPVQRSRTTYSTSYNSLTRSTSSTPHTEYYTDYQSSYECRSVPVTRMRSEMVTETKCGFELETHMVTRYEFQLENQYVPGHFETFTRQRLRELDPVCYALDAATQAPEASAAVAGSAAADPTGPADASVSADEPAPAAAPDPGAPRPGVSAPAVPPPQNRIEGMLFNAPS